jgi:hypothetical protein
MWLVNGTSCAPAPYLLPRFLTNLSSPKVGNSRQYIVNSTWLIHQNAEAMLLPTASGPMGRTIIFEIHVTDTDAKYLDACQQARRHFTPMDFLDVGLQEIETIATSKHLVCMLPKKWAR